MRNQNNHNERPFNKLSRYFLFRLFFSFSVAFTILAVGVAFVYFAMYYTSDTVSEDFSVVEKTRAMVFRPEFITFCFIVASFSALFDGAESEKKLKRIISSLSGVYFEDRRSTGLNEYHKRIRNIENKLSQLTTGASTEDTVKALVDDLSPKIDQSLIEALKKQYSSKFQEDLRFTSVDETMSSLLDRLESGRQTMTFRTFGNLLAGVVIAIIGAWWLFAMVVSIDYTVVTEEQLPFLIVALVARLSVAVLIQIFAYFFLNLYRNGLQEIKFYQNEITNVLSRQAGIRAALLGSNNSVINEAILLLLNTERNFVLKKGETTIGLDQNRIDRSSDNSLLGSVTGAARSATQKFTASDEDKTEGTSDANKSK